MGRGNTCVHGDYEGLYFIDKDYLAIYRRKNSDPDDPETKMQGELGYEQLTNGEWEYDPELSEMEWEDTKVTFCEEIKTRFKSFKACDEWIGNDQHAILENGLFYIAVEDNEWSMAVKLLQKEHWCLYLEGLQAKHYTNYLEGIKAALFTMFDELGTYSGPWTSGRISRPDAKTA